MLKAAMQKFTEKTVNMIKAENLFEPQGGPIILAQIENEYELVEYGLGNAGKAYAKWSANMAVGLKTEVPWVMCKQRDALDPIFHGGTNFGRTAGGPFIATSYDYDAPVDEYGLTREPKYSHLRDLHTAIRLSEPALVSANPVRTSLGKNQEAHVFATKSGACAAFLANYDPQYFANVTFRKRRYGLPPWSISILPHCQEETFNTAKVRAASLNVKMETVNKFSWQSYTEGVPSTHDKNSFVAHGLLEQLNVTRDVSDYLWYTTDVSIRADEEFLKNGKFPILKVSSAGHALQVFINGQLSGTAYGSLANPKLTFSGKVTLKAGINKISLLSVAVGLPNVGLHFEKWNTGVLGPVTLEGLSANTWDLSRWKWSYKTGVEGEMLSLYSFTGSSSVKWAKGSASPKKQALTWYKTTFDASEGKDPLALDMSSMGKGQIWINGQSIGRHWPARKASGGCSRCSYTGTFHENKCLRSCGEATQKWYHVPRSWLQPKGNLLVVFDEQGGDPTGISLVRRTTQNK
ncbi:hypothetical protein TIFTF001_022274 [Ficus carica]|uniref:beta-galactosidase n=1 Tax=Ficus carica TaxID=3494 RepID=A0AA88AHH0_FICCA|nr:hypothetical protein TIFTF001_022274 [Ficus carica]